MATNQARTSGWVTYSGIMLVVAGVAAGIDAIWAFRYSDTLTDLVFFENDLAVWGWIWLALAVFLIATGMGIFSGQTWAQWAGVTAASLSILSHLSWAQVQPQQGLIGALLGALVVYGLIAHGDEVAA